VRAPVDSILAPPFPAKLPWVNVAPLRMDQQRGRPVLVEFWDFCRPNSIRTLPYVRAWHERYEPHGLRVIGIHCPGFPPSQDEDAVRAAVARLGIEHPVCIDTRYEAWAWYEAPGWPARYLWGPDGTLAEYHVGEGGYAETERAIQELVGVQREPLAPVRPEDDPQALLVPQTQDQPGAYSGPYAAGAAWAVLSGEGEIGVGGERRAVEHPGAYVLVDHGRHTEAVLDLRIGEGVECHATCFTPGVAT
jgi:thiol-disulfide isomerase/thioredoxin